MMVNEAKVRFQKTHTFELDTGFKVKRSFLEILFAVKVGAPKGSRLYLSSSY